MLGPVEVTPLKDIATLKADLAALFGQQNFAVLATRSGEKIHTTLVAFAATGDLKTIYVCTPRATRKFTNIKEQPVVSLLVHNSTNQRTDIRQAMAVTVSGMATEIDADQSANARTIYLAKHSHMSDFVDAPNTAMVEIKVSRYDVVAHFQEVSVLEIRNDRIVCP
jgi:general stress protein 26